MARKIRSRFKLEERLERRKKQQEPQMEVDIGREDEGVSVDSMDHLECDTFQLSRDGGNSVFVYNDKISA